MVGIGFIGDNGSDSLLVAHALKAGYPVVVSSLDEDVPSASGATETQGPFKMASPADCARASDVVFLVHAPGRETELPLEQLHNRIVVDLRSGGDATALQELTGSHLVRALLAKDPGEGCPQSVDLTSDWALAKAVVVSVARDLGLDPHDKGELSAPADEMDLIKLTSNHASGSRR